MSSSKRKIDPMKKSNEHLQCQLCPKKMLIEYKHLQRHAMVGRPFKCDKCDSAYKDKSALTHHLKYIHDPKLRSKFECPFCKKSFTRPTKLESNLAGHTSERPYFCKFCPKELLTAASLRDHQNTHRSDRQRNFSCAICPLKFYTRSNARGHIVTHTGEKPFKCEECKKCFAKKTALENHSLVHQSERVSFRCHICSKVLATKGSLRKHLKIHNPVLSRTREEFQCSLCPRKLISNRVLNHHIRSHLKARN